MEFLLFNLCFHAVQVPNSMIASTIAHACGKFLHLTMERILLYRRLVLEPLSSHFGNKLTSSIQMMWRFNNLLKVPLWKMTSGQHYSRCLLDF
jgi:hypothetical protein